MGHRWRDCALYTLQGDHSEQALVAAIDAARVVGWSEDALWPALHSLVTNLEYAAIENRITEADISEARTCLAKLN